MEAVNQLNLWVVSQDYKFATNLIYLYSLVPKTLSLYNSKCNFVIDSLLACVFQHDFASSRMLKQSI